MNLVDFLTPNKHEAEFILGEKIEGNELEAAIKIKNMGPKNVIITLGKQGIVFSGKENFVLPASKVNAVDPVGSGDCFNGALATKIYQNTPIKEGLIINNPQRKLPSEQRKMFERNGWEIIDAAQPAHNSPPPLCYSSVWLSMNVLVLDSKTVCVEKSEVYQAEQLDKIGMEVVPVDLRDAYAFGGGLHCCTADVYREGKLQDYFPKFELH